MTLFTRQPVADSMAWILGRTYNPIADRRVRFPEITGLRDSLRIPTSRGPAPVTIYRPRSGQGRGVYVNLHGGGFVVGRPEQDDPWCRFLAERAGVFVVNVDYLLAPQHRFPAAVQQVYEVLTWVAHDDREWDGSKMCVGGQSAGGNLAAAMSRMSLEVGGPTVSLQVLHYASLDLVTPMSQKVSPLGGKSGLKPWLGDVIDTAYLPDPEARRDRLISPAWGDNAAHIAGIAPALVVTAEYDRLRMEGIRYAARLEDAGALVKWHDVAGVDHGYNFRGSAVDTTRRMYGLIADAVADAVR